MICVVRNPFDAIMDLAKAMNPTGEDFESEWWSWFVKEQTQQYQKYFETLLADCVEHKKNPIYFVRYEDLLANP